MYSSKFQYYFNKQSFQYSIGNALEQKKSGGTHSIYMYKQDTLLYDIIIPVRVLQEYFFTRTLKNLLFTKYQLRNHVCV